MLLFYQQCWIPSQLLHEHRGIPTATHCYSHGLSCTGFVFLQSFLSFKDEFSIDNSAYDDKYMFMTLLMPLASNFKILTTSILHWTSIPVAHLEKVHKHPSIIDTVMPHDKMNISPLFSRLIAQKDINIIREDLLYNNIRFIGHWSYNDISHLFQIALE